MEIRIQDVIVHYDDTELALRIGPGLDGSSADKLSLDLKFNPWDTAITFRPEWRSMTVFPSESGCTPEWRAISKTTHQNLGI